MLCIRFDVQPVIDDVWVYSVVPNYLAFVRSRDAEASSADYSCFISNHWVCSLSQFQMQIHVKMFGHTPTKQNLCEDINHKFILKILRINNFEEQIVCEGKSHHQQLFSCLAAVFLPLNQPS